MTLSHAKTLLNTSVSPPAQLVAAVGALELHDPCGCVVVRATAAHRIGRDGVDVWLTVDLPR